MSFFFNTPAPSELYTLSLHDALPIFPVLGAAGPHGIDRRLVRLIVDDKGWHFIKPRADGREVANESRSEEHTSELQSHSEIVCRLLLEKKNATTGFNLKSTYSGNARN